MAERVMLVVVTPKRKGLARNHDAEEMLELIRSAGGNVVVTVQAPIVRPSPSHFVHTGKLEELAFRGQQNKVNLVIFNVDLSPVQNRNLERAVGPRVVDRTGLILDIFARRAQSKEGRMQVELAQLNYLLPRLSGQGVLLSRLGGGIGTRGPGEQKLEVNRRKIRDRISRIKNDLQKVSRHRELLRESRKRKAFKLITIVGYTNAGKSTLLNALTGARAHVENKLFATLDPMTRAIELPSRSTKALLTDTVGFLRDLPHHLIEAFKATLEEVSDADLLIHVLDASSPFLDEQYREVNQLLHELGALLKPSVLALNKMDLIAPAIRERIVNKFENAVPICAKDGWQLDQLMARIDGMCNGEKRETETPDETDESHHCIAE